MTSTTEQKNLLTTWPVILAFALIANFLWGSAFPGIKAGYALFAIGANDTASQIVFAGCRFTLAGLLVLLIFGLGRRMIRQEKPRILPEAHSLRPVLILALLQTAIQYFFFYIGLAHTLGVRGSVIEGSSSFVAILVAALLFHQEKLTAGKVTGCLIGFSGVVLINLPALLSATGAGLNLGDAAILLSTVSAACSQVAVKEFSKHFDPILLSAWQFVFGGLMLLFGGLIAGGHLSQVTPAGIALLLYLAFVSAAAYSLWSLLLKYNPVSRITVFSFLTPVFGVLLSLLVLHEDRQDPLLLTGSLVLVCLGIILVTKSAGKTTA